MNENELSPYFANMLDRELAKLRRRRISACMAPFGAFIDYNLSKFAPDEKVKFSLFVFIEHEDGRPGGDIEEIANVPERELIKRIDKFLHEKEADPMTHVTDAQYCISLALQRIAKDIDNQLHEIAGMRVGFALLVFNEEPDSHTQYASNCVRANVAEALRDFLKMHDKGDLENDKPTHEKVTKN